MGKMSTAAKVNRIRRAADAAQQQVPVDTGQSVDEMEIETRQPSRRATRAKAPVKTAARAAPRRAAPAKSPPPPPPRRTSTRAPVKPNPNVRYEEDETVPMRALGTRAGQGGPRRRADPTVNREDYERDPHTGRIVITRDGVTYTRRVSNTGDKFSIDDADIPVGMSYQWIAVSVLGAGQRNSIQNFKGNGWREVHTSRYPGRYAPDDVNEHIVIDGLGLYERPIELTQEARAEEIKAARDLIRTRNDQFVPKLPEARARRGTELRAKRSIEGMPHDIGRPVYQMDVDDGLL